MVWRGAGRSVHKGIDDLVNNLPVLLASVSVYGCGKMCARLRQTLRLLANLSRASLSLRAQSRTTHVSHSILTAHRILRMIGGEKEITFCDHRFYRLRHPLR